MISIPEAINIVHENHPDGKIKNYVTYKNLYLFMVFNNRPFEEEMDPFFSVDKETGEFKEFSILTDGDTSEIVSLFEKSKRR